MMIDEPDVKAELQAQFDAYETALMRNDIAALDAFFWVDERAIRFGVGESLFGHQQIAAFRAARPGGSPQRILRNTQICCFGPDHGIATTEFQREGESRPGRQTQIWVRFPARGWRIVSAHVSLVAGGP